MQLLLQMETGQSQPRVAPKWPAFLTAVSVAFLLVMAAVWGSSMLSKAKARSHKMEVLQKKSLSAPQALWRDSYESESGVATRVVRSEQPDYHWFAQDGDGEVSGMASPTEREDAGSFRAREAAYREGWLEQPGREEVTTSIVDGEMWKAAASGALRSKQPQVDDSYWSDSMGAQFRTSESRGPSKNSGFSRSQRQGAGEDSWQGYGIDSSTSRPGFERDWWTDAVESPTSTSQEYADSDFGNEWQDTVKADAQTSTSPIAAAGLDDEWMGGDGFEKDGMEGDGSGLETAPGQKWYSTENSGEMQTTQSGPFPAAETYCNHYDSDNPLGIQARA